MGVGVWAALAMIAMRMPVSAASVEAAELGLPDPAAQRENFGTPEPEGTTAPLPDVFMRGRIEHLEQSKKDPEGLQGTLRILDGPDVGAVVSTEVHDAALLNRGTPLAVGEIVVVVKGFAFGGEGVYYIADTYRVRSLVTMILIFFALAIALGRLRGLMSIIGLALTVGVIVWFVMPRIVAGHDPFRTCLLGGAFIATAALYLAHGLHRRTAVAWVSTLLTLGASAVIAAVFVRSAHLFGMGSEEALFLPASGFGHIDLRGLLLGGIVLGALGILDDITTAQAAVVEELKSANPNFTFHELYRRGISVGREHIAALINTLFLAYAGASLPLFLLFATRTGHPLWFVVNSEQIAEEIVRTLVGSIGLMLAVPLTTALAAAYYARRPVVSAS
ncbi:YibE/F family protein [Candidatus Uhrbacteria bacterium]|nr:YibE/F family protein [Candidatus Uhrbacteria bacterium]